MMSFGAGAARQTILSCCRGEQRAYSCAMALNPMSPHAGRTIMSHYVSVFMLFVVASSTWAYPRAASSQTGAPIAQNLSHAVIAARLSKPIDSSEAKAGDKIVARTAIPVRLSNGTLIPSGTNILGHLTEATALSKGNVQSSLGMIFDKIQITRKEELKIAGTLQAIAPPLDAGTDSGTFGPGRIPVFGGNLPASDAGTVPAPQAGTYNGTVPSAKGATPVLSSKSSGVAGFRNLQMGADSLLTSTEKEIRLETGTQMVLKVALE
jgi:hypothetical protein